jgi:hypothetical protein
MKQPDGLYADGREARAGISAWMAFYSTERCHQALSYRTPMTVYRARVTGAVAVDMTLRLDNAGALPTGPQHQQLTNLSLAA